MINKDIKYTVNISFQEIKLPPFQDILILGANCEQGKNGIAKSFELLIPNGFKLIEVRDEVVEAIFINKRLLKKMPEERIVKILEEKVFKFISEGEILKIDFEVIMSVATIEELND